MKNLIIILSIFISTTFNAQTKGVTTNTISVNGNCEECKARIENAADIKGVKLATWSETTKVLTVTYNADKVTLEQIENAIAAAGHDAGKIKGSEASYKKLPSCCKYRTTKCDAPKK
jgi:mercuric ion binding protein